MVRPGPGSINVLHVEEMTCTLNCLIRYIYGVSLEVVFHNRTQMTKTRQTTLSSPPASCHHDNNGRGGGYVATPVAHPSCANGKTQWVVASRKHRQMSIMGTHAVWKGSPRSSSTTKGVHFSLTRFHFGSASLVRVLRFP